MEYIYKNVLLLVQSLTQLSETTYEFNEEASEESGEKIVEIVDKCEEKWLKVKEEIVKIVHEVENRENKNKIDGIDEINAIPTKDGFLIKE